MWGRPGTAGGRTTEGWGQRGNVADRSYQFLHGPNLRISRKLGLRTEIGRGVCVHVADRSSQRVHGRNRGQSDKDHKQRVLCEILSCLFLPKTGENCFHPLSSLSV